MRVGAMWCGWVRVGAMWCVWVRAGAMENWGLVTYRETALLIDADNSSAASKQTVALVVGHEIAHQWFGNLVTMVTTMLFSIFLIAMVTKRFKIFLVAMVTPNPILLFLFSYSCSPISILIFLFSYFPILLFLFSYSPIPILLFLFSYYLMCILSLCGPLRVFLSDLLPLCPSTCLCS